MPFANRIRLPFFLTQPQFPADEELYMKANGRRVVLKSIVSKEFTGKVDWMPEKIHERLSIALRHDSVNIEGYNRSVGIRLNGSYDIEWQDFLNHPLAPAKFKAFEEAFAARSSKCEICEEAYGGSIDAVDDYIPGLLTPGVDYIVDVTINDDVCCTGKTYSILSWNATLLESAPVIDPNTGVVTFAVNNIAAVNALLFTYQVQCADLTTDTANVYGSIDGDGGGDCEMEVPETLEVVIEDCYGDVLFLWDPPPNPPAGGYGYTLYKVVNGNNVLVATGVTIATSFNPASALEEGRYRFIVWSICGEGNESMASVIVFDLVHCQAPAQPQPLTILVKLVQVVNGYDIDWKVEASIVAPAVTSNVDINLTGKLMLSDENGSTGIEYAVTLLAGNSTVQSGVIGTTTSYGFGSVINAVADPTEALCSDAVTRQIQTSVQ